MFKWLIVSLLFSYLFISKVYAESFGARLCNNNPDIYACYKVKKGDSWTNLFSEPNQRDLVMRINRINIRLQPGMHIAIPHDLKNEDDMLTYAPFSHQIEPYDQRIILVSIKKLAFGAYDEDGTLVFWGPISTGKGYCPDVRRRCGTPRGEFAIYSRQGANCRSQKYPVGKGGAPMPYCMFFYKGFALHGSYDVPGYNASHGCVRLFVGDAEWLNQEFTAGVGRVPVIIRD
jgi:L,D-transpeptidase ErfK/SrfK